LQGLLSFMLSDEMTTGGMQADDQTRKQFATDSLSFNMKERKFKQLFEDLINRLETSSTNASTNDNCSTNDNNNNDNNNDNDNDNDNDNTNDNNDNDDSIKNTPNDNDNSNVDLKTPPSTPSTSTIDANSIDTMSVKKLKAALRELDVSLEGCVEKADLIQRLKENI
jgi:hypothetical protein